jgi:hypothetical protein
VKIEDTFIEIPQLWDFLNGCFANSYAKNTAIMKHSSRISSRSTYSSMSFEASVKADKKSNTSPCE